MAMGLRMEHISAGLRQAKRTTRQKFILRTVIRTDATVSIDNSGSVSFSGLYGVSAKNSTGEDISITNSGDITSTEDTFRRVGIYADSTVGYVRTDEQVVVNPGELEYNGSASWHVTGVVEESYTTRTTTRILHQGDVGSITIENSGTIDMGEVYLPFNMGGLASEGITAVGNDGIDISNSGTIKVSDFSNAINVYSDGGTTIENSGSIEIGNLSRGISVSSNTLWGFQVGDDYRNGGDTTIVNTGDITGGMTHEEALESDNAVAFGSQWQGRNLVISIGISVDVRNTNNEYLARDIQQAELWDYYASIFGEQYFPDLRDNAPNTEIYSVTIDNQGTITLGDGGRGVVALASYGDITVSNSGTITVGESQVIF